MVWDAFTDPLLGHWSDKSNTRIGRRHPFMYTSLLLPEGFTRFLTVMAVSGEEAFVYVLVMALIIRTGVTLFEVPCTALLPDLVKDYDERNRWLSLRHLFGWTGGNGIHLLISFLDRRNRDRWQNIRIRSWVRLSGGIRDLRNGWSTGDHYGHHCGFTGDTATRCASTST